MSEAEVRYVIPDWDSFINSPVLTGDKFMLIVAMGLLDDIYQQDSIEDLWDYLRSVAAASAEEINNDTDEAESTD